MFGLEDNQKEPFAYDIEKQIRKDAKNTKEILTRLSDNHNEIAKILKTESNDQDLAILLEAYKRAPIVVNRIQKR